MVQLATDYNDTYQFRRVAILCLATLHVFLNVLVHPGSAFL